MPPRRTLAVLFLLLGMEACADFSVALGSSLLDLTNPGMALFWLMALCGVGGAVVGLISAALAPSARWHRIAVTAGALLVAGVPSWLVSSGFASGLPTLIFLAAAYARGVMIAQEPPSYGDVRSRFGLGFGVYFLGIVFLVARGVIFESSVWHVLALTGIAYVVLSMVALALSRFEVMREPGAGLAILVAVVLQLGVLVALAIGVLQLLQFNLFGDAFAASRPVWNAIGSGGIRLVLLIAEPVQWVVNGLRPATPHGGYTLHLKPITTVIDSHINHVKPRRTQYLDVLWVVVAILALLLGAILYGIWRAIMRIPHHRPSRGYREQRGFTLSLSDLLTAFLSMTRKLFHRGTVTVQHVATAARRRVQGDWPDDPARRVYVQLLRKAAGAGLPKPAAATPLEFQYSLASRWPAAEGHFEAITEAYMERRYNEADLPPVYIAQLRRHATAAMEAITAGVRIVTPLTVAQSTGTQADGPHAQSLTGLGNAPDMPTPSTPRSELTRGARLLAVLIIPLGVVIGFVELVHMVGQLHH